MYRLSDSLTAMASKPVATGFGLLLLIASSYTSLNALYWQSAHHPSPISANGPADTTIAATDTGSLQLQDERVPRPPMRDPIADLVKSDEAASGAVSSLSLKELQIELTRTGYYLGPIDGLPGPMTTAALDKLEKATGLDVTSKTNAQIAALLERLDASVIASGGDAVDRSRVASQSSIENASYSAPDTAAPDRAVQTASRPQPEPVVQIVQEALAEMGYAPGAIDGLYGAETRAAIVEFERHRSLPQTGQISARLIQELEAVSGRTLRIN